VVKARDYILNRLEMAEGRAETNLRDHEIKIKIEPIMP
jgi:hypothetical protein